MIIVKRKLLTAILSSLLFALLFSFRFGFEGDGFYILLYLNLLFLIVYGGFASVFCDWVSTKIAEKKIHSEILSFILHCAAGSIIMGFGLFSGMLFYIVDRLLRKTNIHWAVVLIAILFVVLLYVYLLNR